MYHFDSKTDMPKDMVGVPVLKLLCQWAIVLAPPPMSFPKDNICCYVFKSRSDVVAEIFADFSA